MFVVIFLALDRQAADMRAMNIAGRQRMLSQKIAKFAVMIHHNEVGGHEGLVQSGDLFEESLRGLTEGSDSMALSPVPDTVRPALESLQAEWEPFNSALQVLLVTSPASPEHERALDYVMSHNEALLASADAAATAVETEATEGALRLVQIALALIVIGLFAILGLIVGVRKRVRAELALQASESALAKAQETAHLGSWHRDLSTNTLSWSDEVFRILGSSPQGISPSHQSFLSFVHPDDRDSYERTVNEALDRDEPYDIEHRIVRPDGTIRLVQDRSEIVRDSAGARTGTAGTVLDITDRKRAEDALTLEHELLQTVLDTTIDSIYMKDRDLRFTLINQVQARLLGASSPDEAIGKTDADFFEHDFAQLCLAADRHIVETGEPLVNAEEFLLTSDGERWLLATKIPILQPDGSVSGIVGTTRDITQIKLVQAQILDAATRIENQAERLRLLAKVAALIASRASVKEINDACLGGVFEVIECHQAIIHMIDPETGRLRVASTLGETASAPGEFVPDDGISPRLIKERLDALVVAPPAHIQKSLGTRVAAVVPIRESGSVVGVLRVGSREEDAFDEFDVELLQALAQQVGIALGAHKQLSTVTAQTDELRENALTIERHSTRLQLVAEVASLMAAKSTRLEFLDACLNGLSDAFDYTGATFQSLDRRNGTLRIAAWQGERPVPDPDLPIPEEFPSHEMIAEDLPYAIRSGDETYSRRTGLGSSLAVPVKVNSEVVGALTVGSRQPGAFDPSDVEVLQILASQLGALTEATAEEEQRHRSAKLSALGQLSAGIAHDLNNLLMGIVGSADLARSEVDLGSPLRSHIERIDRGAEQAGRLANQMLAFAGRSRPTLEILNLSDLILGMAQLLGTAITGPAVIEYDLADDLPGVRADSTQMSQVVMNLITNAIDAIGRDKGTVRMTTGDRDVDRHYLSQIHADHLPEGRYVYFTVSDTGAGMDEETRARIFEPFFTTKAAGHGLGLAAVLGIVRSHGGAMNVYTELGHGTTFRVLLPVAEEPAAGTVDETLAAEDWQGEGTVLIVDDNEVALEVAELMLRKHGLNVLTASAGRTGVELFRRHAGEIDLVLLDMQMPGMTGPDVFDELTRIRPDVRAVLSSGFAEEDLLEQISERGLAGFVQKPYRTADLIRAVRTAMDE